MVATDAVYDVLGIGFGPASLAVAIAFAESDQPIRAGFIDMHDRFAWHPGMMLDGAKMQISFLKDLATMRNPSSTYSFISYLHAHGRLATFVNLSTFTPSRVEFSDYLAWCAERVADSSSIHYGERVERVEPVQSRRDGPYDLVRVHSVRLSDGATTMRTARNLIVSTGGKPQMPPILRPLAAKGSASAGVVLHTAEYLDRIDGILDGIVASRTTLSSKLGFSLPASPPESDHGSQASPADSPPAIEVGQLDLSATPAAARAIRIAVIGAGQSAAETFADVRTRLAERIAALPIVPGGSRPQIDMIIRHGALRPSDDSAFSNEVFDPSSTDLMHAVGTSAPSTLSGRVGLGGAAALRRGDGSADITDEARRRVMAEAKSTNYSVANPRNIESLYDIMYEQRVEADRAASSRAPALASPIDRDPLLNILPWREIESANAKGAGVQLQIRHTLHDQSETVGYDAVIVATGYDRQQWRDILFSSDGSSLLDVFGRGMDEVRSDELAHTSAPAPSKPEEPFTVQRDYRLTLPEATQDGTVFQPRVWLQGCTEATHGISDSLLSVLAVRAGEVAASFAQHANRA